MSRSNGPFVEYAVAKQLFKFRIHPRGYTLKKFKSYSIQFSFLVQEKKLESCNLSQIPYTRQKHAFVLKYKHPSKCNRSGHSGPVGILNNNKVLKA